MAEVDRVATQSAVLLGGSQVERSVAARYAYVSIDIVSRKRVATILAAEATGTQVKALFL